MLYRSVQGDEVPGGAPLLQHGEDGVVGALVVLVLGLELGPRRRVCQRQASHLQHAVLRGGDGLQNLPAVADVEPLAAALDTGGLLGSGGVDFQGVGEVADDLGLLNVRQLAFQGDLLLRGGEQGQVIPHLVAAYI